MRTQRARLPLADGGGSVRAARPPRRPRWRSMDATRTRHARRVCGHGPAAALPHPQLWAAAPSESLSSPGLLAGALRAEGPCGALWRGPAAALSTGGACPNATAAALCGLSHAVAEDGPCAESRPVLRPSDRGAESRGGGWAPRAVEPARPGGAAVWRAGEPGGQAVDTVLGEGRGGLGSPQRRP